MYVIQLHGKNATLNFTTMLPHSDTTFVYSYYPQNCKTLSVIWFCQCKLKGNMDLENSWRIT